MTGSGKYEPLVWQLVTDAKGFECIHETSEDGESGDLVAHVFGDHANLIAAAPTMRDYIAKRAEAGDDEAIQILEAINAGR